MRTRVPLFILLTVTLFVISACSATGGSSGGNAPASTPASPDQAMADASPTPDVMMKDGTAMPSPQAMKDASPTPDAMMKDGTAMPSDQAMEDASPTPDAMMNKGDTRVDTPTLTLSFRGLEPLSEGFAYEGWLLVDGKPVSSGVLTIDDHSMATQPSLAVNAESLAKATAFVLTIEPVPDPDPAPSEVHVLAGNFVADSAALTALHPAALTEAIAAAAGSFVLGIPTSATAADSYKSGIWFDKLSLPKLPAGWVYEGWIAGPDGPLSTGRFTDAKQADSDGAGPTAGPKSGPALPGQDYLNPAGDLTQGYTAVISIEPEPDDSPAPFVFKPLFAPIADAGDHVPQVLSSNIAAFPTGEVVRGPAMADKDGN